MRTNPLMIVAAMAFSICVGASATAQDRVYVVETERYVEPPREEPAYVRFRFGISGVGGAVVASGPDIGMGGAQLRLGVTLGDMIAFYYQPTGLIGALVNRPDGSEAAAGLLWNTAMVELTFADMLQLGVGPSMDFVWGCDNAFQNEIECDTSDPLFGLHGRTAFVFGGGGPGQRGGLTLSLDVHPTFYESDEVALAVIGGLGFDLY